MALAGFAGFVAKATKPTEADSRGAWGHAPLFLQSLVCFFCNHFEELQTVLLEVELIFNNKP